MEKQKDFYDLLADYLSDNLSDPERQEFLRQLQDDPGKQKLLVRIKKIRASLWFSHFQQQKENNYQLLVKRIKPGRRFYLSVSIKQMAAVALLCIVCTVTTLYLYRNRELSGQGLLISETTIPYGSQAEITLPDSSIIRLNAGSTLRYNSAYNKNNRTIQLDGEGYFIVRKNSREPFIVQVGDVQVKVLGTTFNVKGYASDSKIEIGLIEGRVNVFTGNENINNKILSPNEWLVYDKETLEMNVTRKDMEVFTQWTSGRLYFDNASLTEIFKTLERKFNVSIIVDLPHTGEDIFTGNISPELSVTGVIDFLNAERKYRWEQHGNTIYIRER